ncbi:MAG TPA: type VI secretion system tube protein Hcp, partial [Blastocatellia bacterium]|nr:type VI secretion system tube protein Hcp [Blastocatellia bacterium]
MAFDAFLKVEGCPGESTDDAHKEWIEILSYSMGVSQPSSPTSTAGSMSAERANFQDFVVTKVIDKASPKLALQCASGEHFKEVKLELCRAAGDKQKYMEYRMTDCIVTSFRPGGHSGGAESLPLEEVSFSYGKIEWKYTSTDSQTGKAKGDV